MNKYLSTIGLALCLALGLTTAGCAGKTPAATTVGIVGVANVSGKTAMAIYNGWLPAHPQTTGQIDAVKAAFAKYKASELAVLDAVTEIQKNNSDANQSAMSSAIADASTALNALLTLLRTFGVKV